MVSLPTLLVDIWIVSSFSLLWTILEAKMILAAFLCTSLISHPGEILWSGIAASKSWRANLWGFSDRYWTSRCTRVLQRWSSLSGALHDWAVLGLKHAIRCRIPGCDTFLGALPRGWASLPTKVSLVHTFFIGFSFSVCHCPVFLLCLPWDHFPNKLLEPKSLSLREPVLSG